MITFSDSKQKNSTNHLNVKCTFETAVVVLKSFMN